jgi:hypothetical protein
MLAAATPPSDWGAVLIGAGGIGLMLAIRAFEKWRRRRGYAFGERETEHPASQEIAATLARAAHPLDTSVQMFRDENDAPGVVAVIRGLDPTFKLRTTGRTTGDVEVGHIGFDDHFHVQGATAMVRARLDGPTRDALVKLSRHRLRGSQLTVTDGQLRAVVPEASRVAQADTPDETFAQLAQIARRLAEPLDLVTELAKSARQDPLSGVRILCLRTLLREYPQHAELNALLREVAGDPDAAVRLEAATALGPDGRAVLDALVGDAAVEDEVAVRAAETLGPHLHAETARATLRRERGGATTDRRPATARACAAALARAGDPQDEPLLLAIAREDRDESLRVAAVRALGLVGTAQAVPSLAELAGSGSADLRRAGREAIATIQSRLKGATPGQLSLDPGAAGQVALADDAAGRVSETPANDRTPPARPGTRRTP